MEYLRPSAAVQTRQSGFSLVELLVYAAIVAVSAVFIANQFDNLRAGGAIERAYAEIEKVRSAAISYRNSPRRSGSYADITITLLANQGYNVRPFTDGENENTYGRSITLASADSGADATLTYETDSSEACGQLIERYTGAYGIKGNPSCSTSTLTLTLE